MLTDEQKTEFAEERHMIKLEEVASAITKILEFHGCDHSGRTMKKLDVFGEVEEQVEVSRIKQTKSFGSYRYIPVVNNRPVPVPGVGFCKKNWRDIKLFAAEYGYFIVSNMKGEPIGVRLGELQEFTKCQDMYIVSASGMADTYNERAVTIEQKGGEELPEMVVRIRRYKAEREAQDEKDKEAEERS